MKCVNCKKIKKGPIKVHSFRKKIGKKSKNVVEYYCVECFTAKDLERSQDVIKEKERIIKKQTIRRAQRRSKKMR